MKFDVIKCQEALNYNFKNQKLLIQCFTHSSYSNEHKSCENNELLEFFGDSILGYIVTEYLFNERKDSDEGSLTRLKQEIVSKKPLSEACIKHGFHKFLLLGSGERSLFKKNAVNLSENLFEAIVAGIYIDGGIDSARIFVKKFLLSGISDESADYKSKFQEYVQKNRLGAIVYDLVDSFGPPHDPTFIMKVSLNGKILAEAEGSSKKRAEQKCAQSALSELTANQRK